MKQEFYYPIKNFIEVTVTYFKNQREDWFIEKFNKVDETKRVISKEKLKKLFAENAKYWHIYFNEKAFEFVYNHINFQEKEVVIFFNYLYYLFGFNQEPHIFDEKTIQEKFFFPSPRFYAYYWTLKLSN